MRNGFLPVLLAVLAGALVACGSDDDTTGGSPATTPKSGPEEDVRRVAQKILQSTDARAMCTTLATERLLADMYEGDRQLCISSQPSGSGGDAGTPKITGVTVEAAEATVAITTVGGQADGAGGSLEFVKEDGAWKLDALGADYLRSSFSLAIAQVKSGAVSHPAMRACFAEQVDTMSETRLRRVMSQIFRKDPAVRRTLIGLAKRCPEALNSYVAERLGEALEKGDFRPAFVRCFRRKLKFLLPLVPISADLLLKDPGDMTLAALSGLVSGIKKGCGPTR